MSSRPLLEGQIQSDDVTRLKREIAELEQELREMKEKAEQAIQASKDAISAIRNLRKQTQPLYDALRMIHGEISRVDAEAIAGVEISRNGAGLSEKWEQVKRRSSPSESRVIDVLLLTPGLTTTQIAKSMGAHYDTAKAAVKKLVDKGLAERLGEAVHLKL